MKNTQKGQRAYPKEIKEWPKLLECALCTGPDITHVIIHGTAARRYRISAAQLRGEGLNEKADLSAFIILLRSPVYRAA